MRILHFATRVDALMRDDAVRVTVNRQVVATGAPLTEQAEVTLIPQRR